MEPLPLAVCALLGLLTLYEAGAGASRLRTKRSYAEDFTRCGVDDANCLAPAVTDAIRKMKEGRKSLGVPSLSPLQVDEMTLDLGSGPIPLVIHGDNITVRGVADSEVSSASLDPKEYKMRAKAHTPLIRLDFMYKANGKILLVAVKGEGPAFIELQDVESNHLLSAQPYEKKGKTYWNVTDYSVEFAPKKMISHFEGLLKGDPKVSEQVNGFLNEEWKVFYQQIKNPAQSAFGLIFQQIANRVFSRVPFDEIFIVS